MSLRSGLLRYLRHHRGLSVAALARRSGVSVSTIRRLEAISWSKCKL